MNNIDLKVGGKQVTIPDNFTPQFAADLNAALHAQAKPVILRLLHE